MKNILLFLLAFTLGATAQTKNKNAKYTVEVAGNCDQCKKRIEKAALSVTGVKMADWNEDTKVLSVVLNEEKTTIANVEKAVAAVGHDTKNVRASDETYKNLHHCCQYER